MGRYQKRKTVRVREETGGMEKTETVEGKAKYTIQSIQKATQRNTKLFCQVFVIHK